VHVLGVLDKLKRSIEHKIKTGEIKVSKKSKFFNRIEEKFEEIEEILEKDPVFAEIEKARKKTGKPVAVKVTMCKNGETKVEVSDFPKETVMDRVDHLFDEIERSIETKKKQGQREEVER